MSLKIYLHNVNVYDVYQNRIETWNTFNVVAERFCRLKVGESHYLHIRSVVTWNKLFSFSQRRYLQKQFTNLH